MLTVEQYLETKGVTEKKAQVVKIALIEVLMAISAFDPSVDDIKDGLKSGWRKIIGQECKDDDLAFIREYEFKYQNFVLYDKIKYHGFAGVKNKSFCLDYIKSVWFFSYLAKTYEKADRDNISALIAQIKEKEIENGYIKDDKYYVLDSLFKRYAIYSDRAREIGQKIADKYLLDLDDIFEEALDTLIEENDRYSELEHILTFPKTEKTAETTKVEIAKKEEVKPVPVTQKTEVKDDNSDSAVSTEQSQDDENNDEIIKIINLIKEQHAIEISKLKEAYEAKIKSLEYEIDLERSRLGSAEEEIDRARIKGAEEILLTLNSDSYSCILDKLFDIKSTQNVDKDEVINLAIQFYNALRALGYKTVQWKGQKCGDIVEADIPVTELRKQYRWNEEENLDGKERVVLYPGLKFFKSRLVVYNPKVTEKK